MQPHEQVDQMLTKLKCLPPEQLREVEDFVDFLRSHDHQDSALTRVAAQASEPVLDQLWDNPEDAAYDAL